MINSLKIVLTVILFFFVIGCTSDRLYDEVQKISHKGWDKSEIKKFTFSVSDTAQAYDIFLHLRNETSYRYSNLWVFVKTSAPNGNNITDTLEFIIADKTGEWLGSGLGSINSMLIPYKLNIRFPYRGIYIFEFKQAMRVDVLEGITDLGLRVQEH